MLAESYKSLAYIQFSSGSDFLCSLLESTLIIGIVVIIINKRNDNFLRKQLPSVRLIQSISHWKISFFKFRRRC